MPTFPFIPFICFLNEGRAHSEGLSIPYMESKTSPLTATVFPYMELKISDCLFHVWNERPAHIPIYSIKDTPSLHPYIEINVTIGHAHPDF